MSELSVGIFFDGFSLPSKEGITVHTYELACALARTPGVKVTLVVGDRARSTPEQLARQPFDTLLLPPDDYYDRAKITAVLQQHSFDIVQNYNCYYIASVLGPVAESLGMPLIAEHHDLEADLAFLHASPEEAAFQQDMQQLAVDYSVRSRVMSRHDYEVMTHDLPADMTPKLFCMPVCVSGPSRYVPPTYGKRVVFVGNTLYPPNRESALRIITALAPKLPDITFALVGRETKALAPSVQSSNVELVGDLDDINEELSQASLGIAPINRGSGMKLKVMTYLAAGLPVVATQLALFGYPQHESMVGVPDADDEAFIQAIQALLADRRQWRILSDTARQTYKDNFSPEHVTPRLVALYKTASRQKLTRHFAGRDVGTPDMRHFPWLLELDLANLKTTPKPVFITGTKA